MTRDTERIRVVPVTFREANEYVDQYHRHTGRLPTARLSVGIVDDSRLLRGVGIAGAPKARMLMARDTLEVSRVCTDGVANGCSMLYGALRRAAKALGYARLITYTLEEETGASLRASGWKPAAEVRADDGWKRRHPRAGYALHNTGEKLRWEIHLHELIGDIEIPIVTEWDTQQAFNMEAS